ncbi:MAG: hypothetical protein KAT77_05005 [Nanoarchaeota archaeon]|nr:hypothetical protein [Nanoarchaeota archaeon]
MAKYKEKLKAELGGVTEKAKVIKKRKVISREYDEFKKAFLPKHMSYYEKICNFSAKVAKIKPAEKKRAELLRSIDICHLQITPEGSYGFALFFPVLIMLLGTLVSFILFASMFFAMFFVVLGLALIYPLMQMPNFLANRWRMKASNQMVQCIFYIVTYMRHTSNLERGIEFASDHLATPLSLDLRKVLWDVETGKFDAVKDSLEDYLKTWKEWNREFIESFHLVESSLYEASENKRLDTLDKALTVILTETYEKMLHYAHDLQSPITMLHMLGVILPILGLVILPLVVSFMGGEDTSPVRLILYIGLIYNIAIPFGVYYLGRIILSKRPTGYGDSDISEENPELKKYKKILIKLGKKEIGINPIFISVLVFVVLLFIGLSPLVMHFLNPGFEVRLFNGAFELLGYICPGGLECALSDRIGPYGLGASILSLAITLSAGLGFGSYFALRSGNVIKIRNKTKKLEDEFASALFQLGNRLGDGLPAEIAFGRTAEIMEGTTSGDFYSMVNRNITKLGMSVREAIFDGKVGALIFFPSKIIESSMKVLVESIKKGPRIAAQALISMSQYIKEIHRVNERLKDLLSEIISSMQSQIKFLTPAIAGIVVGITSMITNILTRLTAQISSVVAETGEGGTAGIGGIVNLFGSGIPTYYFQIVVGLYVVQITYILVVISNNIENGEDKLTERYNIGKDLVRSALLYCFIAATVMILFNFVAGQIMSGVIGG